MVSINQQNATINNQIVDEKKELELARSALLKAWSDMWWSNSHMTREEADQKALEKYRHDINRNL